MVKLFESTTYAHRKQAWEGCFILGDKVIVSKFSDVVIDFFTNDNWFCLRADKELRVIENYAKQEDFLNVFRIMYLIEEVLSK